MYSYTILSAVFCGFKTSNACSYEVFIILTCLFHSVWWLWDFSHAKTGHSSSFLFTVEEHSVVGPTNRLLYYFKFLIMKIMLQWTFLHTNTLARIFLGYVNWYRIPELFSMHISNFVVHWQLFQSTPSPAVPGSSWHATSLARLSIVRLEFLPFGEYFIVDLICIALISNDVVCLFLSLLGI